MVAKIVKIRATAHRPLAARLDTDAAVKKTQALLKDWARLSPKQQRAFRELIHVTAEAS